MCVCMHASDGTGKAWCSKFGCASTQILHSEQELPQNAVFLDNGKLHTNVSSDIPSHLTARHKETGA